MSLILEDVQFIFIYFLVISDDNLNIWNSLAISSFWKYYSTIRNFSSLSNLFLFEANYWPYLHSDFTYYYTFLFPITMIYLLIPLFPSLSFFPFPSHILFHFPNSLIFIFNFIIFLLTVYFHFKVSYFVSSDSCFWVLSYY